MADWIDALAVEVQRRQEIVGRVEAKSNLILQDLRNSIALDIHRVHRELYDGRSIFEIEDAPVASYDFRVTRADSDFEVQVRLRADHLELVCTLQPHGPSFNFKVLVNAEGDIHFFHQGEEVFYWDIPRLILEDSIREEFNLD